MKSVSLVHFFILCVLSPKLSLSLFHQILSFFCYQLYPNRNHRKSTFQHFLGYLSTRFFLSASYQPFPPLHVATAAGFRDFIPRIFFCQYPVNFDAFELSSVELWLETFFQQYFDECVSHIGILFGTRRQLTHAILQRYF